MVRELKHQRMVRKVWVWHQTQQAIEKQEDVVVVEVRSTEG